MQTDGRANVLSVRRIVITGVLAAIAILLGITRLGFIPVPWTPIPATIMHVPAIIGGVMEGSVVGLLVGLIFGSFSWLQSTVPAFKDPVVAIIPRLFIGVIAYYSYALFRRRNEYLALVVAGVVGTLTNSILVLGAMVVRGYLQAAALPSFIPSVIFEIIIAVVINIAVVMAWKKIEPKSGGKSSV